MEYWYKKWFGGLHENDKSKDELAAMAAENEAEVAQVVQELKELGYTDQMIEIMLPSYYQIAAPEDQVRVENRDWSEFLDELHDTTKEIWNDFWNEYSWVDFEINFNNTVRRALGNVQLF